MSVKVYMDGAAVRGAAVESLLIYTRSESVATTVTSGRVNLAVGGALYIQEQKTFRQQNIETQKTLWQIKRIIPWSEITSVVLRYHDLVQADWDKLPQGENPPLVLEGIEIQEMPDTEPPEFEPGTRKDKPVSFN